MTKIKGLVVLAAAFASVWVQAATSGSCESAAVSLSAGSAKAVVLTREYDEENKAYLDNGTFVLKTTLTRGQEYTAWLENAPAGMQILSFEPSDDLEDPPLAMFEEVDVSSSEVRWVMYKDEWDMEDDPKSCVYYLKLTGNPGQTGVLYFFSGVNLPKGIPDNPAKLTIGTTLKSDTQKFIDSAYYYTAALKKGKRYIFATEKGTKANEFWVTGNFEASGRILDYEPLMKAYNYAKIFTANEDVDATLVVSGLGTNESHKTASFALKYQQLPERAIGKHSATAIAVGETKTVKPGYCNQPGTGYFDQVIDQVLLKFTGKKNGRYAVETTGAKHPLILRLYDSTGKILAENKKKGDKSMDVRAAFKAAADGTYYIGVCEDIDDDFDVPTREGVKLTLSNAASKKGSPDKWDNADDSDGGASLLVPLPSAKGKKPVDVDKAGHGAHKLGMTDWQDVFAFTARKGVTYALKAKYSGANDYENTLKASVYYKSGSTTKTISTSGNVNPGSSAALTFAAPDNVTVYVKLQVKEGNGLDHAPYTLHAIGYSTSGPALGAVKIGAVGATGATWTIDKEKVKYADGETVLLPAGSHKFTFSAVKNYNTPAAVTKTVTAGKTLTYTAYYNDKYDPKDNKTSGKEKIDGKTVTYAATAWSLKNKESSLERSLLNNDPQDNFKFTAKDGYFYDFWLSNVTGDAVMSVKDANGKAISGASKVQKVPQLGLAKGTYYITVEHGTSAKKNGSYKISGLYANVGAIKFAKATYSVKNNAASVKLTVNRTAKDGQVRVVWGTVAGTAKPGTHYYAQNGEFTWKSGDSKAKTIEIKLIPQLLPIYKGDKQFTVQLKAYAGKLASGEYRALITTDKATVKMTETAKKGATADNVYKKPKTATVKTEDVQLYTGTFSGVAVASGTGPTNGLARLASVTFTASTKDALSAKVSLGGKTYSFKGNGWATKDAKAGYRQTLELSQTFGKEKRVSKLTVCLAAGKSTAKETWKGAGGEVELVINVPDAKGKGYQKDVRYRGVLNRDNSKIQNYLSAVVKYASYYTVSLTPSGVKASDGVPYGNGYLTLTIDNKGKAKVAGLLADGSTKISQTSLVSIEKDGSAVVPVFAAKSPYCFGGELVLRFLDDGTPVVDSVDSWLDWYNDNAALTKSGKKGWAIPVVPVGGYYDTVVNLQRNYLTDAFTLDGIPVDITGDKLTIAKNAKGKTVTSPTFTFKRATGLSSGTLTYSGTKSVKHNGVLLLARDPESPLAANVEIPGMFSRKVKSGSRQWVDSQPFNVISKDLSPIDWWADDWGKK